MFNNIFFSYLPKMYRKHGMYIDNQKGMVCNASTIELYECPYSPKTDNKIS